MKGILIICISAIFFAACTADMLDRDEASKLIREKNIYPKVVSYNVFTADPVYSRRMLDAGLENSGLIVVQRTQTLQDAGKPIVSFTDKAKPFLLPTTDEDRQDNIQLVKIAGEDLEEITGVQMLDGDKGDS